MTEDQSDPAEIDSVSDWRYEGVHHPICKPNGERIPMHVVSVPHEKGPWDAIYCRTEGQARAIVAAIGATEAEARRSWIPTSERLPEVGRPNAIAGYPFSEPVAVWLAGYQGWAKAEMELRGDEVYWRILDPYTSTLSSDHVTHWMSITAPASRPSPDDIHDYEDCVDGNT